MDEMEEDEGSQCAGTRRLNVAKPAKAFLLAVLVSAGLTACSPAQTEDRTVPAGPSTTADADTHPSLTNDAAALASLSTIDGMSADPLPPPPVTPVERPAAPPPVLARGTAAWVVAENTRPGDLDWSVGDDARAWDKVRGYADLTSVDRGGRFKLYVSTAAPSWRADAYRLGWYGGAGARKVWTTPDQPGVRQPGPTVDFATRMAEARWQPSLEVDTAGWPPGMYVLVLRSADGGRSYVPMVVRDDAGTAALAIQSAVTTWQAYNGWGDANLYTGGWPPDPRKRARVVSFDRPYDGNGSGELFGRERELVEFAERLGLDVTYWTDVDLDQHPERVLQHKAIITLAHDEYYSTAMRRGLEAGRDAGVNLAFFGANAIYRKIRLEPSALGPARHEVNYRSTADPITATSRSEATVEWRVPPSNEPESALIGNFYECNPTNADWVVADETAWVFEGTGLHNGDRVKGLVGNEYDRVQASAPTPRSIQILAHSPLSCRARTSFSDTTYYTARSGAGVFAAGTLRMVTPLATDCPQGIDTGPPDCRVQRLVENVLRAFAEGPAASAHPARPNLAEFNIALRNPTDP